ncbi:SDR family oxidoreductase [Flavobacterium sp. ARAG 55.4]|uniref:SDR family oxidoreductase n=1 Tax=Flavobacterium sp. ARAG 55.4 TaxID=3451357 RepID=UPI003F457EEB
MDKNISLPLQRQSLPGEQSKMIPEPEIIRKNYKGADKLLGKVALITGGDSGIGRSVAVHFAREGAKIAIIYLEENEDAQLTKELVEAENSNCLLIQGDLKDPEFCKNAVEKVVSEYGKLNILVNNAATQMLESKLEDISNEQLHLTFETNIYPYFYITKNTIPHMNEGDCIINTSSITAYRGSEHLLDYASTKGAIVSFTRSLAGNLVQKNIRVNGVAPGPIWTPLIPASFKDVTNFGKDTPMKRVGQPSEVAPAYVYLASEDSSYVTGQFIHVNGGEPAGS